MSRYSASSPIESVVLKGVAGMLCAAAGVVAAWATEPGEVSAPGLSRLPSLEDRSGEAPLAKVFAMADPDADAAWGSESFGEAVNSQMKALGKAFAEGVFGGGEAGSAGPEPEGLLSELPWSNRLRPALRTVHRDGGLSVARPPGRWLPAGDLWPAFYDLRAQLGELRAVFAKDGEVRMKFKITGVTPPGTDGTGTCEAVLEVVGDGIAEGTRINQSGRWHCRWRAVEGDADHPLLLSVRASGFEEVVARGALFVDATAGLLGGEPSFGAQFRHGADYWYGNLDVAFGIHQGNQGLAVGDADGDGREDLFVCQPAGLPSRLYLREADGSLRDATVDAGMDWLDNVRSALFIDLDHDGDQDLAVSMSYSLVIFENAGGAKFARRVVIDIHSWPSSIAAADYDGDGDLDIYVCGYNPRGETAPGDIFANPVPYDDANNGARNFFIENLGGFRFEDVTERVGLSQNNHRFSFAASWEDYDNDGDPDLYVANDFGRNNLYRNDSGDGGARRFVDVAEQAGVEDIAAGMSVSWGDYNRDGLMDLYVSNMFSAAGNRVTGQGQFKATADGETKANLRRHARGNSLFRNAGDGTFRDVSVESGVTLGRWAWGSLLADLNNDGREDIYVTNGFFSTPDPGDL